MKKEELEKIKLIDANKIIIKGRWFYISAIFITAIISKIMGGPNANVSPLMMVSLTVASYILNFSYYFYFKKSSRKSLGIIKFISVFQLLLDQLLFTAILFIAGGIISISFIYQVYTIIASAFLFSFWGVAFISTTASLMYSSVIILQLYSIIPYIPRYNIPLESYLAHYPSAVYTNLTAIITSFYIIGYFSGLIAKSIRDKEEKNRRERDKIKAVVSDLSDGLIFVDENKKIDLVNKRIEKLLDFKARDILHKNISKLNPKKFPFLFQFLNKDLSKSREMVLEGRSDTVLKISTAEVKNDDNKLIGTVRLARDVSREKFVNKMKSEFITIAGHQLRTPLSAIKGALALLINGDYGKVEDQQRLIIKKSYDYTEKLIKIVNDFLSISSAEEGKFDYQFRKVDLIKELEEINNRFTSEAKVKRILLDINTEKGLPGVYVDVQKIKLAIGAIIDNAITYTPLGGKVNINFSSSKDSGVLISVKDTGIGIPEENTEKVFSKFFRADNALKFYTEGNGLDLYIAKNIIDNHQGKIWFKSEPGKGTEFFIELPVKQDI